MGQAQVFYDLNKCKEVEKKIYPGTLVLSQALQLEKEET